MQDDFFPKRIVKEQNRNHKWLGYESYLRSLASFMDQYNSFGCLQKLSCEQKFMVMRFVEELVFLRVFCFIKNDCIGFLSMLSGLVIVNVDSQYQREIFEAIDDLCELVLKIRLFRIEDTQRAK